MTRCLTRTLTACASLLCWTLRAPARAMQLKARPHTELSPRRGLQRSGTPLAPIQRDTADLPLVRPGWSDM
ncbi:hypothetical protein CALCODRAFT_281259 [Calocera cornea HHB12733]|uniref:Uncharacterized protein n=1 Tax=Calocera cornea HHB12733 TaxID=1353952 RepID=A0A165G0S2_9BASI|nr:hypothetical protein CALCODRAFT_281259 [Calocera cornea HHB12733]